MDSTVILEEQVFESIGIQQQVLEVVKIRLQKPVHCTELQIVNVPIHQLQETVEMNRTILQERF